MGVWSEVMKRFRGGLNRGWRRESAVKNRSREVIEG